MAVLVVVDQQGKNAHLTINFLSYNDKDGEDDLTVDISYEIVYGSKSKVKISTAEWQIGKIYFETLGRSFSRCSEFSECKFPISFYEDINKNPAYCSLYLDIDAFQIIYTGKKDGKLNINVFFQNIDGNGYSRCNFTCTVDQAAKFGINILEELASL